MDFNSTFKRIQKIRTHNPSSTHPNSFSNPVPTLIFTNLIPQSLQELRRNYSPRSTQLSKPFKTFKKTNLSNAITQLIRIFLKHFSTVWRIWKSFSRFSKVSFCKRVSLCEFPIDKQKLSKVKSEIISRTQKNQVFGRKSAPSRQKTVRKLQSCIKILCILKELQKSRTRFSFHALKTSENSDTLTKALTQQIFPSFITNFNPKHDFSIVSVTPVSIIPVTKPSLSLTKESSFKVQTPSLTLPEHQFLQNPNKSEFDSFDLPNLSSYDSFDDSPKHPDMDRFDSGIFMDKNDESLVELECKVLNEDISPTLTTSIKGMVSELAYKSASTASIPQKLRSADRYSQSIETISEVSVSRSSFCVEKSKNKGFGLILSKAKAKNREFVKQEPNKKLKKPKKLT